MSSDKKLCSEIIPSGNKKVTTVVFSLLAVITVIGLLLSMPIKVTGSSDDVQEKQEEKVINLNSLLYLESGFTTWMYAFQQADIEINNTDYGYVSADGGLSIEPVDADMLSVNIYIQPKGLKYSIDGVNAFMSIETAKAILQSEGYVVTDATEFNSDYIELNYNDHWIHHAVILCKHGDYTDITWSN